MLLLIISLFLNYDLFSCVDYERPKFNETVITKRHLKNYLEVKTFIKEAQNKFHEDTPSPPRVDYPHFNARDIQSRHNTSSIDRDQNSRILVSFTRRRPSFPISITPYTTELNDHDLKLDEIFPLETTTKSALKLRIGPTLSSAREIPSRPPLNITFPSPKYQKRFGPASLPDLLRLRVNPAASSTLKNWPNPKFSSKTFTPSLKTQKSRPTPHGFPNTTSPTSLRGHSSKDFKLNVSYMTRSEEYKKKWLREITTYTPVENWFLTLASKIGFTPRFSLTSKHAPQLGKTVSKIKVSTPSKQTRTSSSHLEQLHLRNGLLATKTTKVAGYSISTTATKKPKFFIENQGGILHLRIIPEKNEEKTTTVGKRPAPASAKVVKMNITTDYMLATTKDMLRREQETAAFKNPLKKKSRRVHLKPRKRHRYRHHKNVARQRHQRHHRHPEYTYNDVYRRKLGEVEHQMLRSSIDTPKQVFKRNEDKKHGEPTHPPNAMLQYSEYINTEDENPSKLKETQKKTRRREKAKKDKISFYNQVKETLKQVESKKKAKRLKIKAELIRKIVEGSSYSDEEESLRKNLVQALQNGSRT